MIDSTLLRFNYNIYERYHRKARANKYNFVAFFKFSSIIYIIRRKIVLIYKIFAKQIKYVIIKLKKDITSYNFKESINNNGKERFCK